MINTEEKSGGRLEWRINVSDGTTKVLEPERGLIARVGHGFQSLIIGFFKKIRRFLVESWKIGVAEPKKFIHCLKVGLALCVVSLFYYMRPLYEGVGGNAMWAVMTVVVVFEYTVGATICKSVNRAVATTVAGSLGVGIHWIASQCGQKYEPIVLGASVFIFASVVTFSRFIPTVKARFDYGALIFILTFSLVSVSGYRVDKLVDMAHQRVTTIAIGTSLCILTSMLIWRQANLARWEPAHGRFYFGYPWQQYLKIGAAARNCAYCIDNLNSCIDSEFLKQHIKDYCMKLSNSSSKVLKELAKTIKSNTKSSTIELLVDEMNTEVEDLQNTLKSLSYQTVLPQETMDEKHEHPEHASMLEVLSLGTVVTLLIEAVGRIEEIAEVVDELANKAEFKTQNEKKPQQKQSSQATATEMNSRNHEEMKALEKV